MYFKLESLVNDLFLGPISKNGVEGNVNKGTSDF